MRVSQSFGVLLLLALTGAISVHTVQAEPRVLSAAQVQQGVSLTGDWRFQSGDDLAWAAPGFDDSHWPFHALPHRVPKSEMPDPLGFFWYRLTLALPASAAAPEAASHHVGVQIGKILSAYELYAGGQLIGGVGKMPPHAQANYDRVRVFAIPATAVSPEGKLVLALRVWGGSELSARMWGEGPHEGAFRLGHYNDVLEASLLDELPVVAMCVLFTGFGLYHLYLFRRNRQLRTYLWYGLLALDVSVYTFLSSQLRYHLDWPFELYEKIEFAAIYLVPALFIQMLLSLLALPVGLLLRLYQGCFVVFSLLALWLPGMEILYRTLLVWEFLCLPVLLWVPWVIVRAARAGNQEARTAMVGLAIFTATGINDILIDLAGLGTPRLLPVGFVAIMLSMVISLANRFTTVLNNLESEVAEQTAELRTANEKLAAVASEDPLTGLLNRRGFLSVAAGELQRFQRTGREFSVILGDLDFFKQINDQHGHACGDFVLREVATLLRQRVREIDILARWGGEEFILIVPETSAAGAAALADTLRDSVASHEFRFGALAMAVTMTVGVATFRAGETLEQCVARADQALYRGKEGGRNRIEIDL